MPYRLKLTQRLDKSFRRVGLEQIDHALARLASRSGDHAVDVHETRKCMKRLRALLRIARPSLGEAVFKRENARFRDIAQLLAATRDRHVLIETLVKLQAARGEGDDRLVAAIAKLRAVIEGAGAEATVPPEAERAARAGLLEARRVFARIELSGRGFKTIEGGLRRTYAAAREALPEAYRLGTDEAFHELRKHVQQHWRHMLLVSRAWPAVFAARATAARNLSQALGDDHDLAVLADFVGGVPSAQLKRAQARLVIAAARSYQGELRSVAELLAKQLLVEEPRAFARRVAAYWQTARRHARLKKSRQIGAADDRVEAHPAAPAPSPTKPRASLAAGSQPALPPRAKPRT